MKIPNKFQIRGILHRFRKKNRIPNVIKYEMSLESKICKTKQFKPNYLRSCLLYITLISNIIPFVQSVIFVHPTT